MSKLSLCEIQQSQLDKTPIVDGQLVCCLDTGNTYRDTAGGRVRIGSDLERVSELPLAPLAGKIYYLPPGDLSPARSSAGPWPAADATTT